VKSLKEYRLQKQMTQREVAEYLGITQAQYWKHETGKSLLNTKQIIELCHLFGCTPNDLLGFRGVHTVVSGILDNDISSR
jgi:transcriptional regulator with XRE-family HTH domain